MKAFEAVVGSGNRAHAVVMQELPPYGERRDNIYLTVCRAMVRGSSVYQTEFNENPRTVRQCDNCLKRYGKVMERGSAGSGTQGTAGGASEGRPTATVDGV